MKRRISIISLVIILALTLACLVGCGSVGYSSKDYSDGSDKPNYDGVNPEDKGDTGIGSLPSGGVDNPNAKIIKTAYANISTKEFDKFIDELYEKITSYSGYTDSETMGNSYSGYTDSETMGNSYSGGRYANITIRIPAGSLEDFKNELSGLGTMTYYSAEKQDVTLTYETLKAEVETLNAEVVIIEELFNTAKASGDLSKITEIEKRLTDIRLRIAEANAKLKVYDNAISYSTVNLTVNEVEEEIIEVEEEKNAFQRIGDNLKRGFINVGNFFVELFVFFISALPYILLISVFAAIALFIVFFSIKKKRERQKKENGENSNEKESNTPKE